MEQNLSPAEELWGSLAKTSAATSQKADGQTLSAVRKETSARQESVTVPSNLQQVAADQSNLRQPAPISSDFSQPKDSRPGEPQTEDSLPKKAKPQEPQREEGDSFRLNAKTVAKIAVFAALCTVLYFVPKISVPGLPPFLELNLSDIPMLVGGFALGPVAGAIIVFCKILFKLPFTSTCCVGELADLLIGLAYVVPASLIYKKRRSFSGAILGLTIGTVCSVAFGMLTNRLILIPFYVKFMGMSMESLVNICKVLSPDLTVENFYRYYIFGGVLPFNLLRCALSSVVTVLLYKRISKLLKMF